MAFPALLFLQLTELEIDGDNESQRLGLNFVISDFSAVLQGEEEVSLRILIENTHSAIEYLCVKFAVSNSKNKL